MVLLKDRGVVKFERPLWDFRSTAFPGSSGNLWHYGVREKRQAAMSRVPDVSAKSC